MKVLIVSKSKKEISRLKRIATSAIAPFRSTDVVIQALDEVSGESSAAELALNQRFDLVLIGSSGAASGNAGVVSALAKKAPDTLFISVGRSHVPEPNIMTFRSRELTAIAIYKALEDRARARGIEPEGDGEGILLTRLSSELDQIYFKLDEIEEVLTKMSRTALEKYAMTVREHMGTIAFSVVILIVLASAVWIFLITMPDGKIRAVLGNEHEPPKVHGIRERVGNTGGARELVRD